MAYKQKGPLFFKSSIKGYKKNSPDINEPKLKIPSGDITMKEVEFPVHGKDNLGNEKIMKPGKNYKFPGDYVIETPLHQNNEEPLYEGEYEEGGLKRDRFKNLPYEKYKKVVPAKEKYVMPEDWGDYGFSEGGGKAAFYRPNEKTIYYKNRPVPYKDPIYPTSEQKKHENIHHLQEMEGGKGSVLGEFFKDRDAYMKKFKKGEFTQDPYTMIPHTYTWEDGSTSEGVKQNPNPSGKWEDLPKSSRKKMATHRRKTFNTRRDIPGTIEHDATVRTKAAGPGYYKEKFSKK